MRQEYCEGYYKDLSDEQIEKLSIFEVDESGFSRPRDLMAWQEKIVRNLSKRCSDCNITIDPQYMHVHEYIPPVNGATNCTDNPCTKCGHKLTLIIEKK